MMAGVLTMPRRRPSRPTIPAIIGSGPIVTAPMLRVARMIKVVDANSMRNLIARVNPSGTSINPITNPIVHQTGGQDGNHLNAHHLISIEL